VTDRFFSLEKGITFFLFIFPSKNLHNYNKEMETILFVTAFKDIRRDLWGIVPRSKHDYIRDFIPLAETLKYNLLVYVEDDVYNTLEAYNFPSNIHLIKSKEVQNTFFDRFLESEKEIMYSDQYKSKIPSDRKGAPEHIYPEYTLINHTKINYVADAKKRYPNYEYYSWLDFGAARINIHDVPKNIKVDLLKTKISYLVLNQPPVTRVKEDDMLKSHSIYFPGGQFIVHTSLVETFETLVEEKLISWREREKWVCDDDQNLILQIYFDHPELFQLYHRNEWLSLFRVFLNSA
jgi:hypothetical protein